MTETHVIDCDATPFILPGCSIREEDQLPNRVRGIFTWDPTKVRLYLSRRQRGRDEFTDLKYLVGTELREELVNKPVLPANVLDYLLAHPLLIPEEYKSRAVFFWGTIYRNSDDNSLRVRFLCWDGGDCDPVHYYSLSTGFSCLGPAAVRIEDKPQPGRRLS